MRATKKLRVEERRETDAEAKGGASPPAGPSTDSHTAETVLAKGGRAPKPGPKSSKEKRKRETLALTPATGEGSGADSDKSARKRLARDEEAEEGGSTDSNESVVSVISTSSTVSFVSTTSASHSHPAPGARRPRGRPPITGEYVGRAAAMRELVKAERDEIFLSAERTMMAASLEARKTRASIPTRGESEASEEDAAEDPGAARAADLV